MFRFYPPLALFGFVLSTSALAQTPSADIEVITVSAVRTQNSLDSLSSNATVLNNQTVNTVQAEHINQLMVRVPGAWISRGNGQEHLTAIRSPVLTGAGGCGAFFMAQDGISARAPGFCNTNQLFDLNTEQAQSVEVIRGPSGVLYGSNAVHGVINVTTPTIAAIDGLNFSVENGANDYFRAKVAAATQGNKHGFAILANGTSDGGYKQDSGYDQQKVTLIHQFAQDNLSVKNVFAATNLNQETAGFIRGFDAYRDPQLKSTNPNPEAFRDNQTARLYSIIEITGRNGGLFTLKPYLRWANMRFLQHFLPWQPTETNRQRSAGVQAQFEQTFDSITVLTGFDTDITNGYLNETQAQPFSPTLPAGEHYDYSVDAQTYSPFAKFSWARSQKLTLDAGLRFEKTRYDYDNQLTDGSACEEGVENCRFTRPSDQVVDFEEWSYQIGFNYAATPTQYLYGQISSGYRAPQATELFRLQAGQNVADLNAESITGTELGWRGVLPNLSFDITVFDMQKDNFIFQDTDRQNISNGSTSHRGVEVAGRMNLSPSWHLGFSGTLARHRYENDLTLSRTPIKGNEIDTAPEHMASLQLGWQSPLGHSAEVEYVHQGNYFLDPQNTASYDGHNLINLRANYQINESVNLGLRVINLTNVDYAERADFAFGGYRYFVGESRAVFVTLGFNI